ncbi:phosphoenolpyruvate--protein phosphotransferase [Arenibaculum pallidiluteum]|uniref:phosphoenolpyruvate--protein phosphotransferase n=1 Tax=Arenibaculum pallidiluteum TaxID=2812559 RepID=UPI001F162C67|nr:phosphoenolpyruvate--protein phosphotransferase [Arenibaculum pallidiluteum]
MTSPTEAGRMAVELGAPIAGWAMPLAEVPDPAFAQGLVGDGVAIDPTSNELRAPCDGVVISVHRGRHACTLRAANGAEILLHFGVDTVGLKGEGFSVHVADGSTVRLGDLLITVDLDLVSRKAPSLATMMVVVAPEDAVVSQHVADREVAAGEPVLVVSSSAPASAPTPTAVAAGVMGSEGMGERRVRLPIANGLHARPAAALAEIARSHDGPVTVSCRGKSANAKSVVALMALATAHGDELTLAASGPGAAGLLDRMAARIASGLGDPVTPLPQSVPVPARPPASGPGAGPPFAPGVEVTLSGTPAVPGLASGIAVRWLRDPVPIAERGAGAAEERARLHAALEVLRARLASAAADGASILAAHRVLLEDPELLDAADAAIRDGASAEWAWRGAVERQAAMVASLADPRLAERAADLRDLERQVLDVLAGRDPEATFAALPQDAVLVAYEILPSELIAVPSGRLAGLCMAQGGPTSHAAIIAASLGVPTIVALGAPALRIPDGAPLLLDGSRGRVRVFPPQEAVDASRRDAAARADRRSRNLAAAHEPCRTAAGTPVSVLANLGKVGDAGPAVALGAEGCGLLRTEFLFLDRAEAPDEDEQLAQYQAIADALGGRPLVVRTLDAGGDKPLPYLPLAREENPALGLRGVRISLREPSLLRTQLRAVLRVRPAGICRIMVPMIASPCELAAVRAILDEERRAVGRAEPIALGAMVEVPTAAVMSDRIAAVADFLSIGTNDLSQYVLAMDRGNPAVAPQLDALHPGVLRLIRQTVEGASAHGRVVAVCGGAASDPMAAPLLIGLGVTRLSAAPTAIPDLKALVRTLDDARCREVASTALSLDNAQDVRRLVADAWPDL